MSGEIASLLEIIVFDVDPVKPKPVTHTHLAELVGIGINELGAPLPIVPTKLYAFDYKIVTYPPLVKVLAHWAERRGIVFSKGYAAVATKLFDLLPTREYWLRWGYHLDAVSAACWLSWGLNWMVVNDQDVDSFLVCRPEVLGAYNLVREEADLRSVLGSEQCLRDQSKLSDAIRK